MARGTVSGGRSHGRFGHRGRNRRLRFGRRRDRPRRLALGPHRRLRASSRRSARHRLAPRRGPARHRAAGRGGAERRIERWRVVFEIGRVEDLWRAAGRQFVVNGRSGLSVGGDLILTQVQLAPRCCRSSRATTGAGRHRKRKSAIPRRRKRRGHDHVRSRRAGPDFAFGAGRSRASTSPGMIRNFDTSFRGEGARTVYDSISANFTIDGRCLAKRPTWCSMRHGAGSKGRDASDLGARSVDYRVIPAVMRNEAGEAGLRRADPRVRAMVRPALPARSRIPRRAGIPRTARPCDRRGPRRGWPRKRERLEQRSSRPRERSFWGPRLTPARRATEPPVPCRTVCRRKPRTSCPVFLAAATAPAKRQANDLTRFSRSVSCGPDGLRQVTAERTPRSNRARAAPSLYPGEDTADAGADRTLRGCPRHPGGPAASGDPA